MLKVKGKKVLSFIELNTSTTHTSCKLVFVGFESFPIGRNPNLLYVKSLTHCLHELWQNKVQHCKIMHIYNTQQIRKRKEQGKKCCLGSLVCIYERFSCSLNFTIGWFLFLDF